MRKTSTSKLHKGLGIVGFLTFLITYIVFPIIGMQASKVGSVLLVASYMTLLGFGHLVSVIEEIRNGRRRGGDGNEQSGGDTDE